MTANEFNSWYESEPKQCFYCDIPLDLLSLNNHYTNHRDSHNLFTIDRKECGGDYSLENIVLACPLCNLVKSNFFSADTMRELAQRYVKPRWQQQAGIEPEALFPDIDKDELIVEMRREYEQKLTLKEKVVTERVEKQERERIIELIKENSSVDTPEYIDKNGKHWQGGYLIISLKNWQALRGD